MSPKKICGIILFMGKNKTVYSHAKAKKVFVREQIKNYYSSQETNKQYLDKVFYKDSRDMKDVPNGVVDLIITSPPYFNIKDYSKDGWQKRQHSEKKLGQIGDISDYEVYIQELLKIWKECERVLKPNGKIVINAPLMPMLKRELNTHYNRHIFDIATDIQHSILKNIKNIFLYDIYIWNRTNWSKKLMFGSYPYPRNFYAQNTIEFITVYVKGGVPANNIPKEIKEKSRLTEKEWVEYTKQIWNIPIPNKNDIAFGKHPFWSKLYGYKKRTENN